MRLWRALLYFYAIGPALMAVAALTLSTPFALALAAFAASAWWAARRLDARATVACGLAAFLPALVMTRLTVPGVDAPLLLRVSVVGAGVWCALCIVVARALKAAPRNRDPQPEDPEGIAKRLASLREYSRRIDRDLGRGALRCAARVAAA